MTLTWHFRPDEQPSWNYRGPDVEDYLTQLFSGEGRHEGQDDGLVNGSPIRGQGWGSVVDVVYRGWGGGWGTHVVVDYGGDEQVRVAHMLEVIVAIGDSVHPGMILGYSNNTGSSSGPHTHTEDRIGFRRGGARGRCRDPRKHFAGIPPKTFGAPAPDPTPTPPPPPEDPDMASPLSDEDLLKVRQIAAEAVANEFDRRDDVFTCRDEIGDPTKGVAPGTFYLVSRWALTELPLPPCPVDQPISPEAAEGLEVLRVSVAAEYRDDQGRLLHLLRGAA